MLQREALRMACTHSDAKSGAHPDARTRVSFFRGGMLVLLVHLGSQAAVIMSVSSSGPLNVTD
jgi:hypothetical protein